MIDLRHGDAFELLGNLEAGSVDLLLTDPPYGTTKLAFDKAVIDWPLFWKEVEKSLPP